MISAAQITLIDEILACSTQKQLALYVVGGVVRDVLLGEKLEDRDIDIVVAGNAIPFGEACVERVGGVLKKYPDFLTCKIVGLRSGFEVDEIDLASVRTERYLRSGALPEVKLAQNIYEDLARRDFTINAMALPLEVLCGYARGSYSLLQLESEIIDSYEGKKDLEGKQVRVLHEKSFLDDPTRIFRAVRYSARLDAELEDQTASLMIAALKERALDAISEFRKLNELRKILQEPANLKALELIERFDLLNYWGSLNHDQISILKSRIAKLRCETDARTGWSQASHLLFVLGLESEFRKTYFKTLGYSKGQIIEWEKSLERIKRSSAGELSPVELMVQNACK
ncbi:MAG: CCA tRNA nucleotidyltransferase [Bdellovibrionales bacterium]|nr:CCA tRNA nucleotidyltransferase [Bdellovibrionales bacterium]